VGGTRENIGYKCAFRHKFEDEPPRGADEWRAAEEWSANPSLQTKDWPDFVRERWEQYHLEKSESLGFKITIRELIWETSWLFTEKRIKWLNEEAERYPELSMQEIARRLLLEHLKEVTQQPDYFADCGEEKYERLLGEMGIRKVEKR
jgi:hypothetical protein